jgi:single-stranded-DNA-specific exonuclease
MSDIFKNKWIDNTKSSEEIESLVKSFDLDEIILQISLNRGFKSKEEIEHFLYPSVDQISKEFCPLEISKAVNRVIFAIENNQKICVYGDYDADGITGTVLLVDAFKNLGADVSYYVPLRYTEGYGMNMSAIRTLKEQDINLIVTVDCGISNYEEISFAKELGIDVVITDHHTPPNDLPPALAIVNPKIEHEDANYFLAGVGVAYKFAEKIYNTFKQSSLIKKRKYLELVAIGTITDVVPLLAENRIFVKEGLKNLNGKKLLGLQYLLEKINFDSHVDSYTIGFGIGPRLNAAGRLASAKVAIDLLKTSNVNEAKLLSEELNKFNEKRKIEGNMIYGQALSIIDKNPNILDKKILVLSSDKWEAGVIGIVASQLAKKFERPVALISINGDIARGSIRSFANVNIFPALETCKEFLVNYGGHKEAAGFELRTIELENFRENYILTVDSQLSQQDLRSEILIDKELSSHEITIQVAESLKVLEPYGEANREPIFITKRLCPMDYSLVGKDKNHLRVFFEKVESPKYTDSLNQDNYLVYEFSAIGFNMGEYKKILDNNDTVDVVYNLSINEFHGKKEPQLKMIDIRPTVD